MSIEIYAAIIAASATIIAALIPFAVNGVIRIRESRRFLKIGRDTASSLKGRWIGYTKVRDDKKQREYRATIQMEPKNRIIVGTIHVTVEGNPSAPKRGWELHFSGGLIRQGYVQLDYWNRDPSIKQFGSLLYEIKSTNLLEGRFVAMGKDLGRMIYGDTRLEKQA